MRLELELTDEQLLADAEHSAAHLRDDADQYVYVAAEWASEAELGRRVQHGTSQAARHARWAS